MIDFNGISTIILCQNVRESYSMDVHIYIFVLFLKKFFFLPVSIEYKQFLNWSIWPTQTGATIAG